MTPGPSAIETSQGPRLTESPRTTPPSPQSQGLGSTGKVPLSGDIAQPSPEDSHFIKVGFHIGRFITAAVNTEEECAVTEALKNNLYSAS
jgi:hypothetical protein